MRKPLPLRPGDTIAVIAPAGAVNAGKLQQGIAALEKAGFSVQLGEHVFARHGYLAGTDPQRAQDFQRAWSDPAVRAVIAARGGFGSTRILPLLDCDLLRQNGKILLGFSDVTALLHLVLRYGNLVTFHGPVVTSFAEEPELAVAVLAALSGGAGELFVPAQVLKEGEAEGPLVGGCLSVLMALLGTPYEPVWDSAVLFLEDVREAPYRIDRMLTQLRQAGVLKRVKALVFGEMLDCRAGGAEAWSVWDVIADHIREFTGPVVGGVPSGHGANRVVLPLGVRVRVDSSGLRVLESPFAMETPRR